MISVDLFMDRDADLRILLWTLEEYNEWIGKELLHWQTSGKDVADIIFYQLEDQEDIDLLRSIRKNNPQVELVVISNRNIPVDCFLIPELHPILFMASPLEITLCRKQILSLIQYIIRKKEEGFCRRFTCQKGNYRRVFNYSSIRYFESKDKKMILHDGREEYSFYDSFSQMEKNLPEIFIRCHRSYMVNILYLEGVDFAKQTIVLKEGVRIPISKKYGRHVEKVFRRFLEK